MIYAYYFLGMRNVKTVRAEVVSDSSVCESIKHGLHNIRAYFEKNRWQR
jgi:RNA polymerase sigma-70 factor (ECF subfamily)